MVNHQHRNAVSVGIVPRNSIEVEKQNLKHFRYIDYMLKLYLCLLLICLGLLAQPKPAIADDAAAVEKSLRQSIAQVLGRVGYLGRYANGQELQRGISAYLWDNRNWLKTTDFHSLRQLDAVVCLLHKKGYPGFENHLETPAVRNFCRQLVAKP